MKPPYRSPEAVSENISDLINGRIVCELGCGAGDNIIYLMRFAKKVFGLDINQERLSIAKKRGLDVYHADYRIETLPDADVYYFWPTNVERDTPFLIWKIIRNKKFNGKIIAGADGNLFRERYINYIISIFGGNGYRQSGVFFLAIIDKKDLDIIKVLLMIILYALRIIFFIKVRAKRYISLLVPLYLFSFLYA